MSNYGYNGIKDGLCTVRGFELQIEAGCLIFRNEKGIQLAVSPGEWRDVWNEDDE